jgi:hypothetical protein
MIFWCFVFLVIFSWDLIKNIVKSWWIGCWHKDCKTITINRHGKLDVEEISLVKYSYTIELECLACKTRIKVLKKYRFNNCYFVEKEAEKIRNKLKIFN